MGILKVNFIVTQAVSSEPSVHPPPPFKYIDEHVKFMCIQTLHLLSNIRS